VVIALRALLYYPGCSVRRDYSEAEAAGLATLRALGYSVVELSEWYCCGGQLGLTSIDHQRYVSSLRTLSRAMLQVRGSRIEVDGVVTLCPFCYNTLKQAERSRSTRLDIYERVASYLRDEVEPYAGGLKVLHYVQVLYERRRDLAKLVKRGLGGLKVAVYYGCMLLRPRAISIDDPDKPTIIESILKELEATPVEYPYKTFCCGSFHSIVKPEIVASNTKKIAESAKRAGAVIVTTPCMLCLENLKRYTDLSIIHLSELIAYALGLIEHSQLADLVKRV
jgi:heterodisulfide reductase subunit B